MELYNDIEQDKLDCEHYEGLLAEKEIEMEERIEEGPSLPVHCCVGAHRPLFSTVKEMVIENDQRECDAEAREDEVRVLLVSLNLCPASASSPPGCCCAGRQGGERARVGEREKVWQAASISSCAPLINQQLLHIPTIFCAQIEHREAVFFGGILAEGHKEHTVRLGLQNHLALLFISTNLQHC